MSWQLWVIPFLECPSPLYDHTVLWIWQKSRPCCEIYRGIPRGICKDVLPYPPCSTDHMTGPYKLLPATWVQKESIWVFCLPNATYKWESIYIKKEQSNKSPSKPYIMLRSISNWEGEGPCAIVPLTWLMAHYCLCRLLRNGSLKISIIEQGLSEDEICREAIKYE